MNDERGLEQNFTVQEPPPGNEDAGELVLRMKVGGMIQARLHPTGAAIDFASEGVGPVLSYGHLRAFDATGRELSSRFRMTPGTTTYPLDAGSDNDGLSDGTEDSNRNGIVDPGETDPNKYQNNPGGAFFVIPKQTGGAAVIYLR